MEKSRNFANIEERMEDSRPLFRDNTTIISDENSSVDFTIIQELKTLDEDGFQALVETLVTEFIETTPLHILDIRHCAIAADPHLKNRVYSLKKSCTNLGAKRMVRILHLIEEGKTSFNTTLQLIDGLEDEFFAVYNDLLPYSSWYSLMKSEGWG